MCARFRVPTATIDRRNAIMSSSLHLGSVDYTNPDHDPIITPGTKARFWMFDDSNNVWDVTVVRSTITPLPNGQINASTRVIAIKMHDSQFTDLCNKLTSHTQFNLTIYYTGTTVTRSEEHTSE